ncbi:unnamed protein product [Spirodela intermedia]|uniref:Uncharacterized protein n=1 Tax=Spirodela intermedia TaxID=51605 RepID=A0A7I8LKG6_SPIIN|nr:unnamed protein product [Spirodela intermedia]
MTIIKDVGSDHQADCEGADDTDASRPRKRVMFPPRKMPKVTAGLTWPPEMLAPAATATNRAKP